MDRISESYRQHPLFRKYLGVHADAENYISSPYSTMTLPFSRSIIPLQPRGYNTTAHIIGSPILANQAPSGLAQIPPNTFMLNTIFVGGSTYTSSYANKCPSMYFDVERNGYLAAINLIVVNDNALTYGGGVTSAALASNVFGAPAQGPSNVASYTFNTAEDFVVAKYIHSVVLKTKSEGRVIETLFAESICSDVMNRSKGSDEDAVAKMGLRGFLGSSYYNTPAYSATSFGGNVSFANPNQNLQETYMVLPLNFSFFDSFSTMLDTDFMEDLVVEVIPRNVMCFLVNIANRGIVVQTYTMEATYLKLPSEHVLALRQEAFKDKSSIDVLGSTWTYVYPTSVTAGPGFGESGRYMATDINGTTSLSNGQGNRVTYDKCFSKVNFDISTLGVVKEVVALIGQDTFGQLNGDLPSDVEGIFPLSGLVVMSNFKVSTPTETILSLSGVGMRFKPRFNFRNLPSEEATVNASNLIAFGNPISSISNGQTSAASCLYSHKFCEIDLPNTFTGGLAANCLDSCSVEIALTKPILMTDAQATNFNSTTSGLFSAFSSQLKYCIPGKKGSRLFAKVYNQYNINSPGKICVVNNN